MNFVGTIALCAVFFGIGSCSEFASDDGRSAVGVEVEVELDVEVKVDVGMESAWKSEADLQGAYSSMTLRLPCISAFQRPSSAIVTSCICLSRFRLTSQPCIGAGCGSVGVEASAELEVAIGVDVGMDGAWRSKGGTTGLLCNDIGALACVCLEARRSCAQQ